MNTINTLNDTHLITFEDKQILLVGTAHISQESVEVVRKSILEFEPDHICIELDESRYKSLKNKKSWESLNLLQVIKKKQIATLLFSLILSSYQKKLSLQTKVSPGSEMLEADNIAKEKNIVVSFCDRDAKITLKRAWRLTSFYKKTVLVLNIFGGIFDKTKVDEKSLNDLRQSDSLTEMMKELGKSLPSVKKVLIDERDLYLAEKIKLSKGKKILAVVGAGHIEGIKETIRDNINVDLKALEVIPKPSLISRLLSWAIPVLIILAICLIGYFQGFDQAKENAFFWIWVNGFFCSLGALLALAHPITILVAFIAAPITSLSPLIGAGYVTAFIQVLVSPPSIKEMQSVGEDFQKVRLWWKNKTLKIFLAFLLPGLGSAIGTWIGGYEIIKNFISSLSIFFSSFF